MEVTADSITSNRNNVNVARNKVFHLENSMIMYGIYNVEQ